jgi:uncharacterized membrane protein
MTNDPQQQKAGTALRSNEQLMALGRERLSGLWGIGVGATFLYFLATGIPGSIPRIGGLISLVIGGPLTLGFTLFFLRISRGTRPDWNELLEGFNRFAPSLVAYLLVVLFVALWSLLLIVPGIIAALSYSMTFYILIDNPDMSGRDAMRRSREMMEGHKEKLFYLTLRFLGWALLSILTLGIGFLFLTPYVYTTLGLFYDDIRGALAPESATGGTTTG